MHKMRAGADREIRSGQTLDTQRSFLSIILGARVYK